MALAETRGIARGRYSSIAQQEVPNVIVQMWRTVARQLSAGHAATQTTDLTVSARNCAGAKWAGARSIVNWRRPRQQTRASRATSVIARASPPHLVRLAVAMPQPRATFVAQPPLLPPRARAASRFTRRRPRAPGPPARLHPRAPRAVFLPPDSEPDAAADDADELELVEQGDAAPGSVPASPPRHGSLSNLDRLLENTEPRYTTWQQERARSSLSTFSYDRPLLGADELNESLRPSHLQRHRHVLAPDEQFAAVFMWDTVVFNARELEKRAWTVVAEENTLPPPDLQDIVRAEEMAPEAAVKRVFYWFADWGDVKRYVFRKAEVYQRLCASFEFRAQEGISDWLNSLDQYGVKTILCSPHPRQFVMEVLQSIGLASFSLQAISFRRRMSACRWSKFLTSCSQGTATPYAKVVALLGVHAAYELGLPTKLLEITKIL
ncbi:Phosphoglycolate phosphatase-like protein [Gracilaria domingensis]|nr:Phosphoglycolate phosphatase-like protein [Gracilaria domingensis]